MSGSGVKRATPVNKTPPQNVQRVRRTASNQSSRTKRSRAQRSPETTSSSDSELPPGIDERTEIGLRKSAARNGLTADVVKNIIKKVCRNDHVLALVKLKEEAEELEQRQQQIQHSTPPCSANNTINAVCPDGDANESMTAAGPSTAANNSSSTLVLHSLAASFVDDIDDVTVSDPDNDGYDTIDEDDDVDKNTISVSKRSPFKLTRAKARALNKQPLPILPLPGGTVVHQPPPEIASIIMTDLRSDEEDDDEEYQPGDDDLASDDDFNITFSDLESFPATPASAWDTSISLSSPPSATRLTKDGLFKIPSRIGSRAEHHRSMAIESRDNNADYIIAQQTRSKVSLETTPIEIIESNFQPPDLDTENVDCSITSEYMQFLKDTISDDPINVEEDDGDDDEDFQLPSSNTPFADREEMYNRPIPQQECLGLFDDLLNHIDSKRMNSHPELQTLIRQLDETQEQVPSIPLAAHATAAAAIPVTPSSNPAPNKSVERQRSYNWKTRHTVRLFRHLATEPPPVSYDFGARGADFLDWQVTLLEQQLRQHVQLATQNFLQVYGHPGNSIWMYADTFKGFLDELREHDTSAATDERSSIVNLMPALDLVHNWETQRSIRNKENRGLIQYLDYHTAKSKCVAAKGASHFFFFHPLVSEVILCSTGVFLYSHLLPGGPFRLDRQGNFFNFMPSEDFLIAIGLERYYAELRKAKADRQKRCKERSSAVDVSLNSVCKRIESEMMRWRRTHPNAVYRHVVRRRNQKDLAMNPIQFFFKHEKAPSIKHVLHPFDAAEMFVPIIGRDRKSLSKEWQAAAKKIEVNPFSSSSSYAINQKASLISRCSSGAAAAPRQLQVACSNCSHISDLNSSVLLDDTDNQIGTRTIQSDSGPIIVTTIVCAILNETDLPETVISPLAPDNYVQRLHYVRIFGNIVGRFRNPVRRESRLLAERSRWLRQAYSLLVSLDVYVYLWHVHGVMSLSMSEKIGSNAAAADGECAAAEVFTLGFQAAVGAVTASAETCDAATTTPTAPIVIVQQSASVSTATTPVSKKMPAWKMPAATAYKVLLDADMPDETNERDTIFAQNFLERVEALYASPVINTNASSINADGGSPPVDRYAEFLRILTAFDARTSTAVDLYARCEAFFLPDHPELAQLFLAFLLPADAARLGRFIEHNIMQNMSHFVGKLTVYFQKQPAQMRKILTALKDLADERPATLTVDRIRAKIVPMLRGNALLIEWFQQCFASDSMGGAETAGDYDAVVVPKSGADYFATSSQMLDSADGSDANETFEEIAAGDLVADPADHPCHIRYMNGHIFYGSKIVLPVQLSFQTIHYSSVVPATAAAAATDDGANSDADTSDDGRYECVHEIKRIGDRKLDTLYSVPDEVPAIADATITESSSEAGQSAAGGATAAASDEALLPQQQHILATNNSADKCCNDLILRAHAVRLNPTLHATQLRKNSDMLELLKRPATAAIGTSEKSSSPKKRNESNSASNNSHASPSKKCKLKRPTAKSARKPSATSKQSVPATQTSPTPAAAPGTSSSTPTMCIPIVIKSDVDNEDDMNATAALNSMSDVIVGSDEAVVPKVEPSSDEVSEMLWSRDEDKIVLEQIKCGFTSAEELVKTLFFSGQLPNRSAMEIRDRFTFLMDIIANL